MQLMHQVKVMGGIDSGRSVGGTSTILETFKIHVISWLFDLLLQKMGDQGPGCYMWSWPSRSPVWRRIYIYKLFTEKIKQGHASWWRPPTHTPRFPPAAGTDSSRQPVACLPCLLLTWIGCHHLALLSDHMLLSVQTCCALPMPLGGPYR